mmetsp:Transcript_15159/g.36557  ORF Transcript_15159/g.36557 Transcript_15159/m.36557 type:complete len:185 (-) Transcript_15159:103-657(-)
MRWHLAVVCAHALHITREQPATVSIGEDGSFVQEPALVRRAPTETAVAATEVAADKVTTTAEKTDKAAAAEKTGETAEPLVVKAPGEDASLLETKSKAKTKAKWDVTAVAQALGMTGDQAKLANDAFTAAGGADGIAQMGMAALLAPGTADIVEDGSDFPFVCKCGPNGVCVNDPAMNKCTPNA